MSGLAAVGPRLFTLPLELCVRILNRDAAVGPFSLRPLAAEARVGVFGLS